MDFDLADLGTRVVRDHLIAKRLADIAYKIRLIRLMMNGPLGGQAVGKLAALLLEAESTATASIDLFDSGN